MRMLLAALALVAAVVVTTTPPAQAPPKPVPPTQVPPAQVPPDKRAPTTSPKKSVNPDDPNAAIIKDFLKRVDVYVALHKKFENTLPPLPKQTTPQIIDQHERALAKLIQAARSGAKQGDLFTPEVVGLFQHLVSSAMRGKDGALIRTSFQRAEPIQGGHLDVNASYPDGLPLQSMPPSLLLNLPRLPKELEYRFVGRELILRDTRANLIVDVIPDLRMPQTK